MKQTSWVPATILVMSNMIGTGIFMLPSQLSKIGGISLISWLITLVGVISLALVLAKLAYLSPKSAGLYSYVKVAFGKYCGHQINFIYSFAGIIGNVAVISVLSGYLADIMPVLKLPFMSLISQIIILGLVFIVNIKGYRAINFLQSASLLLSLTPVIYLIFFGWNLFSLETFKAGWNITHISTGKAITSSFHVIMYSFIGLESACVSSALIKNYKKHVPTATITGVIITATLYIIASTIIMGIVPYNQLIISNAPFTLALQKNLGKNTILLIDICIIISCFNALCGWTMVTSQMIKDGAKDNIFPAIFAKGNYNDIPTYGLILITISTIFIVFLTTRPTINQQFAVVLDVSVLLYLIVYFYSCASYFIIGIKKLSIKSYLFYGILSLISLTFCLISFLDTEFTMLILAIAITSSSTFFYLFRFIR